MACKIVLTHGTSPSKFKAKRKYLFGSGLRLNLTMIALILFYDNNNVKDLCRFKII